MFKDMGPGSARGMKTLLDDIVLGSVPDAMLHDMELHRNYRLGLGSVVADKAFAVRWQWSPADRKFLGRKTNIEAKACGGCEMAVFVLRHWLLQHENVRVRNFNGQRERIAQQM